LGWALDRLAVIAAGDAKLGAACIQWPESCNYISLSLPRMVDTAEDAIHAVPTGAAQFAVSIYKLQKTIANLTGKTVTMTAGNSGDPIVITDPADESFYSLVSLMRA
jgi:hypothetical protein